LAIPFYENYESKSKKLMTAADQYKWWSAYILIGNDKKAEELRNRILNNKSILTEADQYAQFDAKKNKAKLSLLKIRLATDGGFFNLAEQQIRIAENTLAPTDENRAELAYRIGRLAQLKSENGKAISSFKKVLEFNINPLPYYIPNTAFQLGEIFKTQSQLDSAHIFYKKCLQYKDYPYESSIKKKASLRLKEAGK
jgi:tetratricopeptide (TPR) repeat protein